MKVTNDMEYILITNDIEQVKVAEDIGIDRVMIDLEIMGKQERQGHLDTLISSHSLNDISHIRKYVKQSKLMVRINPLHDKSREEIDDVIKRGAEIIMLPMFTSKEEVQGFIRIVNGRAKTCLLLETARAMVRLDEILEADGIDEVHIGLNDLHLDLKLNFMFEILTSGLLEFITEKIKKKNIKYGFGGIARIGIDAPLKSELVLSEHKRIGSTMAILSRDFSQNTKLEDLEIEYKKVLKKCEEIDSYSDRKLLINKDEAKKVVNKIIE